MSQISKLFTFYLKKIFKKNWLRIMLASLVLVVLVWFGLPYLFYRGGNSLGMRNVERNDKLTEEQKEKLKKTIKSVSFRDFNRAGFGDQEYSGPGIFWEASYQLLEEGVKQLAEAKKAGLSEEDLKKIKKQIEGLEIINTLSYAGFAPLIYNADNSYFFNQNGAYKEKKSFWKLLNDISWWNLTSFIFLFWLVFNILDNTFFNPKKDGEELMVLTFTPGVKRSDLFWAKVLAFLAFYAIINFVLFLIPYGFHYWWVAPKTSLLAFSLLTLYTTIIGPILFFGLILAPYLFASSFSSILGTIFSSLVSFFSVMWFFIKSRFFPLHTWPYWLEAKFFDPLIFTIICVICGFVFLSLYYWKNQEEDLG